MTNYVCFYRLDYDGYQIHVISVLNQFSSFFFHSPSLSSSDSNIPVCVHIKIKFNTWNLYFVSCFLLFRILFIFFFCCFLRKNSFTSIRIKLYTCFLLIFLVQLTSPPQSLSWHGMVCYGVYGIATMECNAKWLFVHLHTQVCSCCQNQL